MIISKTPVRISFIGGGSDIPEMLEDFDGNVVSTTINKYIFTIINKKYDDRVRISYSKTENVNNTNEILNPVIREGLRFCKIYKNIELVTVADIPSSGSGLGSSSSLLVGLLNCIYNKQKIKVTKNKLIKDCYFIEKNILKKNIGLQDQCNAVIGGLNHFSFKNNKKIITSKINLSYSDLSNFKNNLMLFYTGINRKAEKILNKIKIKNKKNEILELSSLALEFKKNLIDKKFYDLGKIMNESWKIKRKLDKNVSNSFIDSIYNDAIKVGASGGKILGAGGGGYFLFIVKKELHKKLEKKLKKLTKIDFEFEKKGSTIIYNE